MPLYTYEIEPIMMRVFRDEPHDIPVLHEVRYYGKVVGDSYKGQNILVLKQIPRNNLSSKQLSGPILVVSSTSLN